MIKDEWNGQIDFWPLDVDVTHNCDMTLWVGPNSPIYFPMKPSKEAEKAILTLVHYMNPGQAVSCEWDMSYRIEVGDPDVED